MNTPQQLSSHMRPALRAARKGIAEGQSPFGAAIYDSEGILLSREHNRVKELVDPTAHAEVMAIRSACNHLGRRDLTDHWIFATCEPCPMCAAAIVFSGIRHVVFGADVNDAVDAGYKILQVPCLETFEAVDQTFVVHGGILARECRKLLLNP